MILRKSDLTDDAIFLGLWDSLCDIAGIPASTENEDAEIEILEAKKL
jgi:hypothetical protein